MSNIVEFSAAKLPSFLAKVAATAVMNADLTTGVGAGFPVLSIKGKVFTLVKSQERNVITRPDDPEEAASFIEVVLIKANANTSKVWYAKEFEDGEMGKPDCSSSDGKMPDASIAKPQCKTCAACPNNVFGSSKNGKGKACSDNRRVAISPAGQINEPMLLRIPPATLKPLMEYGKMLNNRGVPYNAVVTKIRFERDEATPKLKFEAARFLSEEEYAEVQELLEDSIIEDILSTNVIAHQEGEEAPAIAGTPPKAAVKSKVSDEEFEQAIAPKKAKPAPVAEEEEEAPAPAPKPKAKAKPAPVAEEEEAPAPAPKPKAKAAPVETMSDDLDSLLAALDD